MMPTFPRSSLSFRTAGFPQYGWKAGFPGSAFADRQQLKPAPSLLTPSNIRFASALRAPRSLDGSCTLCRGRQNSLRAAVEGHYSSAPGALAQVRVIVPVRHHLVSPIPSHSWTHRDFTARRLIRDAFAVRERLGDPRVVPGFRCSFLPDMPPSMTPGSSIIVMVQFSDADMAFATVKRAPALPMFPQSVSRRARFHLATLVHNCCGLSGCWPPLYGPDRSPGQRGLLLPGFQRVGRPSRCWI